MCSEFSHVPRARHSAQLFVYLYDSVGYGIFDEFRAVAESELFEYVCLVHDYGLGADIQHVRDFLVGVPFSNELEYLFFPVGQPVI